MHIMTAAMAEQRTNNNAHADRNLFLVAMRNGMPLDFFCNQIIKKLNIKKSFIVIVIVRCDEHLGQLFLKQNNFRASM